MDKKNLISTMKDQHKKLQVDLSVLVEERDGDKIGAGLEKFKIDLKEHLEIEDGVFYVELLKEMKEKGQDTRSTELFRSSMNAIAKVVGAFLDQYKDVSFINQNISSFSVDLKGVLKALKIRIESEEEGVYDYFLNI